MIFGLALLLVGCGSPAESTLKPTDSNTVPTLTTTPIATQTISDFPTVDALNSADVPPRDRVDLARRFFGVTDIPVPPSDARTREVGEQQNFWVTNSSTDSVFQITATLRGVGEHIYVWVDSRANVADNVAESLTEIFDDNIYETVRELWGSEASPGIDGDTRVYALFAHDLAPGVAGYFASSHLYPEEIQPNSNEHEMFIFNLDSMGLNLTDYAVQSVLGHEFQHMIRANVDDNEDTWMDEGFSMYTELRLAYPNPLGAANSFFASPRTQLNAWTEDGSRAPHYGAAMLFIDYIFENYGNETLRQISDDDASGIRAVENVIGVEATRELLANWVLANIFMMPETIYGYHILPAELIPEGAAPMATYDSYPLSIEGSGIQHAADYYELTNLGNATTLDVSLNMATTTPLLDTTAPSGQWMMYGNKGDNSDTTLTRAFDLSGVESATLNYRVWYHFEENWDYGYVVVSTDNGATWQLLSTPHTNADNPNNSGYGAGYTGESFVWWDESVSLNAYVGQQILLRFEVITDDSISHVGMVIDDVRIPELDYSENFENGAGGWEALGWIRTDNRLPQEAWIQVAQQVGDDVVVSRWLFPDEGSTWSVALELNASRVLLVVFPFTPVTVVPVAYTVNVGIR